MRLGVVAAFLALVAASALVAIARVPSRAVAQSGCADPGFVTDYNTFVLGDHRVVNDSVDGRMAVGRDAFIQQFGVGNRLSDDASRVDLLVGRDIVSGGNARANHGAVTYGRTLSAARSRRSGRSRRPTRRSTSRRRSSRCALPSSRGRTRRRTARSRCPSSATARSSFTGTDAKVNVFRLTAAVTAVARR